MEVILSKWTKTRTVNAKNSNIIRKITPSELNYVGRIVEIVRCNIDGISTNGLKVLEEAKAILQINEQTNRNDSSLNELVKAFSTWEDREKDEH